MNSYGKRSGKKARAQARLQGITIDEVSRELPYIQSEDKPTVLRPGKAVRYSMKRYTAEGNVSWSFLMRTQKDGAQFPNGFLFRCDKGEPDAMFRKTLEKIAKANESEYIEFEGTEASVNAYWEEWGGAKQAAKVQQWLVELSKY